MRHELIFIDDAPSLAVMDLAEHRGQIRDWLRAIMDRHEVSVAEVSRRAQVGRNTIYRALEPSEADTTVTSTRTIMAISKAFDEPPPDSKLLHRAGFADGGEAAKVTDAIWTSVELPAPSDGGAWRLTTRALELAGYLPGDILKVDFTIAPQHGDVVCAQVYDLQRGSAETIFRLFEPPYLTAASLERRPSFKPLYVDGDQVIVRGVVVQTLRQRAAAS